MVVVSILPHAEIGSNDYQVDAPHFKTFAESQILLTLFYTRSGRELKLGQFDR